MLNVKRESVAISAQWALIYDVWLINNETSFKDVFN